MVAIVQVLTLLLDIYVYIIIASIMVNWMVLLGVMNMRNNIVQKIYHYLNLATAPVFTRLRKFVPPLGGLDFTPIILLIGINIIQGLLYSLL